MFSKGVLGTIFNAQRKDQCFVFIERFSQLIQCDPAHKRQPSP